jgi:septum site-determining protein MinC
MADWLAELDKWVRTSPGFFAGKPVILDLAALTLSESAIAHRARRGSEGQRKDLLLARFP